MIRYSQVRDINTLKILAGLCNQHTLLREDGASYTTHNTHKCSFLKKTHTHTHIDVGAPNSFLYAIARHTGEREREREMYFWHIFASVIKMGKNGRDLNRRTTLRALISKELNILAFSSSKTYFIYFTTLLYKKANINCFILAFSTLK